LAFKPLSLFVSAQRLINALGCDEYGYSYGRSYDSNALKNIDNCNHPKAFGWISCLYFVAFCIFGGQVLLTLFIGIITTSMDESKNSNSAMISIQERVNKYSAFLDVDLNISYAPMIQLFELLNERNDHSLSAQMMKRLIPSLQTFIKVKLDFSFETWTYGR
jgi:hypothetical protein